MRMLKLLSWLLVCISEKSKNNFGMFIIEFFWERVILINILEQIFIYITESLFSKAGLITNKKEMYRWEEIKMFGYYAFNI